MKDSRPRLRSHVEPVQVQVSDGPLGGEGPVFLLRDRARLAPDQVVVPMAGLALAALLDGSRTLRDAQAEMMRRHQVLIPLPQVEELVRALDAALLLDGPRVAEAVAEFARAGVRPPACIGSYPGEPHELRDFLARQYEREGGPGGPPRPGAGGRPIRAVVSPHIDLHRGGHCYAWAWRAVAEACPARLFVVFGTSHTGTGAFDRPGDPDGPRFALTRKTFETPLGPVPSDGEAIDRLLAAYDGPDDLFAGEFHHRGEHSIEFQAVHLAHLFGGGRRPVRILPVLCGGLGDLDGPPGEHPRLRAFHAALRAALAPLPPEEVAFVAAIDLAHVGAQFQMPPLPADELGPLEARDRETLRLLVEERCPDRLHRDIVEDGDARNICGHAPLVALLEALRGEQVEGELLRYDRWYDGESTVSFASAVFRR